MTYLFNLHGCNVYYLQVAASGAALYSSLAIIFAAVAVVIGILCVIHRTSQARRKINFEVKNFSLTQF